MLTVNAPAKVNLYLGVQSQRDPRGYHRVDSVMCSVCLHDTVTVEPSTELQVACVPDLGIPAEATTMHKAAVLLGRAVGREPKLRVRVEQRIPARSGLGGASADAAATIVGLCTLWGLDARSDLVADVARAVGADVPFFLTDGPAWLDGGGDRLRELFPSVAGTPVVLVRAPGEGVPTPRAYATWDARPIAAGPLDSLLDALRTQDRDATWSLMSNNLQAVAAQVAPEVRDVLALLADDAGVVAHMVSGSGSCCFGVCASRDAAERVARAAQARGWWSCATELQDAGARVLP